MIQYNDIRDVHLEISSLCNASCPWCPRTFWGYPYNGGYPEHNLTLAHAETIFKEDFLKQLISIRINGNFGDIVMNPNAPDIVEYFKSVNPALQVVISTNGSARDRHFWTRLAKAKSQVSFCLDGLEDTHHLYRQNTTWKTIIKNAKTFIDAGGIATWKFIVFDHNRHQLEQCKQLSTELGFINFDVVNSDRTVAPVFNKTGNLTHTLGNYTGEKDFKILFHKKKTDLILLEDITPGKKPKSKITCETQTRKSIYISATGEVSPCCWTGFYPHTYGAGQYHQAVNAQLIPLIVKNNALNYTLEECINWFSNITTRWNSNTYETGRLVVCDDNCGSE